MYFLIISSFCFGDQHVKTGSFQQMKKTINVYSLPIRHNLYKFPMAYLVGL